MKDMEETATTDRDLSTSLSADEKKRLGSYLRQLREEKHLSQEEFSELMNCTPQYISDVERGKYAFSLKKIITLCDHFGISSDRLIYGNQERYSEYDKRTRILGLIEDMSLDQLDLVEEEIRLMKRAFNPDNTPEL